MRTRPINQKQLQIFKMIFYRKILWIALFAEMLVLVKLKCGLSWMLNLMQH